MSSHATRRAAAMAVVAMFIIAAGAAMFRGPACAGESREPLATVSGTVRHEGTPLAGVSVTVYWQTGSETQVTGAAGTYSAGGVPSGGYVRVTAKPPEGEGLVTHNWSADSLAGDTAKDFDIEHGNRVTGEFRLPGGSPFAGPAPSIVPIELLLPSGEFFGPAIDDDGLLDLFLPPAHYAILENPEIEPWFVPPGIVDLTGGDVAGLVVTLQHRPTPLPTTPPIAELIAVGTPDLEGYAVMSGAPGAVPGGAAVIVINLNAHDLALAFADQAGTFDARLYAPPGSSLLIKYDPKGDQVTSAWRQAWTAMTGDAVLNSLPGTIIRSGTPAAGSPTRRPFYSVGAWAENPSVPTRVEPLDPGVLAQAEEPWGDWAGWWISGTLSVPAGTTALAPRDVAWNGLRAQPGETMTLTARLRVTAPAITCTEPLPYAPAIQPELVSIFGADGWADSWGAWFTSYLFTPTGLPIEREAPGARWGRPGAAVTGLVCLGEHVFEGEIALPIEIPAGLPPGIYLPLAEPSAGGVPLEPNPLAVVWYNYLRGALPPVRIGEPDTPRIPWSLLDDQPVNGYRGVLAREDEGRFAMPVRSVTVPHRVVVPRFDEHSGQPIHYRLEPGSNWLSSTDRRQPNPPVIPFAFPSGELRVDVLRPDGRVDHLGPAPIRQSLVRTPATPGGSLLNKGTGYIGDLYRLTTLDGAFDYAFAVDGHHVITLSGQVEDLYGNAYPIQGTYDVDVARVLDLDPAQLPTTPYVQGDAFAPGLHIFPPVPAQVTVEVRHLPFSDPARATSQVFSGQANRFGYFQPPGPGFRFELPGEFRVDLTAEYLAPDGTLWMGSTTWGSVVEAQDARIEAHGRRGMDAVAYRLPWFAVENLPSNGIGTHVNYPYFSGDIHWGSDVIPGDSIQAHVTIRDKTATKTIYDLMRTYATWPHALIDGDLEEMIAMDEGPLFTPGRSLDPGVFPENVELFAYWYGSSQRPDVRVREVISIGGMPTAYWRFDDTYGYQIGEPADGDQPGDIKWEFGGAVFRVISETNPIEEYAAYSSFWVLLPKGCDAFGCTRVTSPFQYAAGGLNGGPIMTLLGQEIDMLFLPKGVRPGDVLHTGDTISFSGHVGPPLDSRVDVTITSPGGGQHTASWHANKLGWLYDPGFDLVVGEPGRWTVDVLVEHDRPYAPTGLTPAGHNTGTVPGTAGRYEFYVVEPDAPRLLITSPEPGVIQWPAWQVEPVTIRGVAPAGTTAVYYTIHDKGVVMGQGSLTPGPTGAFELVYDAEALHDDFPMLSLTAREGLWEGLSDEVSIRFLAVGGETPRAAAVTLIGEEVFVENDVQEEKRRLYLPLVLRSAP